MGLVCLSFETRSLVDQIGLHLDDDLGLPASSLHLPCSTGFLIFPFVFWSSVVKTAPRPGDIEVDFLPILRRKALASILKDKLPDFPNAQKCNSWNIITGL